MGTDEQERGRRDRPVSSSYSLIHRVSIYPDAHLLGLPRELRDLIYKEVVAVEDPSAVDLFTIRCTLV